jgi:type III pantothenate kinase
MRLLLDIGNTRIKWAVQTDKGLDEQQAVVHAGLSVAQLGTQVFAPSGQVTQVLVSNVAGPAMAEQVRQATRDCWQLEPQFVVATASVSAAGRVLRNAYAEPAKLGSDRWLALLGARVLQPDAALVVSVGTAVTLDALSATGQHLGGMIVPGPDLMMSSLMHNTSDIAVRAQQGQHGNAFFADNTLGCVYQGSIHAVVALIEKAHARLQAQVGPVRLVSTGGGAAQLQTHLSVPMQLLPDLVLRGLAACFP